MNTPMFATYNVDFVSRVDGAGRGGAGRAKEDQVTDVRARAFHSAP